MSCRGIEQVREENAGSKKNFRAVTVGSPNKNPINRMFLRLIYSKNSTFPSVKITVGTLIDVRNETSKHHNHIPLLYDANVPVRFRAQQRVKYS